MGVPAPPELFDVPIEPFELGEEVRFRKVAVQDAHRIRAVQGGNEPIPRVPYGFDVARGHVTSGAYQREIFQGSGLSVIIEIDDLSYDVFLLLDRQLRIDGDGQDLSGGLLGLEKITFFVAESDKAWL